MSGAPPNRTSRNEQRLKREWKRGIDADEAARKAAE
jgi:hypothetical protein